MVEVLPTAVPLLLVAVTSGFVALLAIRALRDESVVDAVRIEVRRIGETHRAVSESRGVHTGVPRPPGAVGRRKG